MRCNVHTWGDEDFDWKALTDCEDIMWRYGTRIGRVGGQIKEKYGTLRYYAHFGNFDMHNLFYPGYVYVKLPRWFHYYFEEKFLKPIYKWSGLNWLFSKWQVFWYSFAYNKACKKHPHIVNEILGTADHPQLIKNYEVFMYPAVREENSRLCKENWDLRIKEEKLENKIKALKKKYNTKKK